MKYIVMASFIIIGFIHLLPLFGFAGTKQLHTLYGVTISDPSLEILIRHRAILFGILGMLFIYAAFTPSIQLLAFITAFVSVASYLYLSNAVGDYNQLLKRVYNIDIVCMVILSIGAIAYCYDHHD